MTKEKIEGSPLARRRLTLGAEQPTTSAPAPENSESKHKDAETSKHKDAEASDEKSPAKKRTTIYIPEDLAVNLKVYAARHKQDVSEIITKQMQKFLAAEEE